MTAKEREAQVQKQMKILGVSEEEARQIVAEDEEIDGWTMKELKEDMGEEAWNQLKKATKNGEKKTRPNYKFEEKGKKKVKVSDEKTALFTEISEFLQKNHENVEILKENKLIQVKIGEKTFKIDLIEQRAPKKS